MHTGAAGDAVCWNRKSTHAHTLPRASGCYCTCASCSGSSGSVWESTVPSSLVDLQTSYGGELLLSVACPSYCLLLHTSCRRGAHTVTPPAHGQHARCPPEHQQRLLQPPCAGIEPLLCAHHNGGAGAQRMVVPEPRQSPSASENRANCSLAAGSEAAATAGQATFRRPQFSLAIAARPVAVLACSQGKKITGVLRPIRASQCRRPSGGDLLDHCSQWGSPVRHSLPGTKSSMGCWLSATVISPA